MGNLPLPCRTHCSECHRSHLSAPRTSAAWPAGSAGPRCGPAAGGCQRQEIWNSGSQGTHASSWSSCWPRAARKSHRSHYGAGHSRWMWPLGPAGTCLERNTMAGGTDWLMDEAGWDWQNRSHSLQLSKTMVAKTVHSPQASPSPQKIPIKPQADQREAKGYVCVMAGLKNPRGALNQTLLKAVPKNNLFSLTRAQSPFPKICGMVP